MNSFASIMILILGVRHILKHTHLQVYDDHFRSTGGCCRDVQWQNTHRFMMTTSEAQEAAAGMYSGKTLTGL